MNVVDDDKRKKIIDKVKKLMKLSSSSYKNEALVAITKTKKLLKKYNISEAELDNEILSKKYSTSNIVEKPLKFYTYKKITTYKDILITHIGLFFDCEVFRDFPFIIHDYTFSKCLLYVGFPLDVEIASYVAEVILRFIENKFKELNAYYRALGKKRFVNNKFKMSYVVGFLTELDEKLKKFKEYKTRNDIENDITSSDIDLEKVLVIKNMALNKYVNKKYNNVQEHKENKIFVNNDFFELGKKDGEKLNLNMPVTDDEKIHSPRELKEK